MAPRTKNSTVLPDELRAQLRGELITREDAAYDEAREVFFKGFDRKPQAVARVADAKDVARVVTAARDSGIELAVRSGGHSRAGHGTSDGGLVIDLSAMKAMEIDTDGGDRLGRDRDHGGRVHRRHRGARARHRVRGRGVGRRRWNHARRGDRVPGPQERPDDRRPARGRARDRRRRGATGERGIGARPLLGDPRRREQLRGRHAPPAPAARDLGDRRRDADPARRPRR